METIEAAALEANGTVWTLPRPARHCHIMHAWCAAHYVDGRNARWPGGTGGLYAQGFVTSTGRFVIRSEAARIAHQAGQLARLKPHLYSEDLW